VGSTANKPKKNTKPQANQKPKTQNDHKRLIDPAKATILVAIISLIGIIFQTLNKDQPSIHATQTAEALHLTQTASIFTSVPPHTFTPTFTPTATLVPTETITPYPEPSINVVAPTRDNLNLVPIIYFGYQYIKTPGTRIYKINVSSKVTYLWKSLWCTKHSGTLAENLNQIKFSFFIDDIQLPESKFLIFKEPRGTDGWPCQRWTTMLSGWNTTHFPTLSVVYYIPTPLSDGVDTYSIGEYRYDIIVTIID